MNGDAGVVLGYPPTAEVTHEGAKLMKSSFRLLKEEAEAEPEEEESAEEDSRMQAEALTEPSNVNRFVLKFEALDVKARQKLEPSNARANEK